jgi:hypothetical protein
MLAPAEEIDRRTRQVLEGPRQHLREMAIQWPAILIRDSPRKGDRNGKQRIRAETRLVRRPVELDESLVQGGL